MNPEEHVISVASYIELLNEQLKMYKARIVGEITQVKIWPSGHVYFTLKDKEEGAILDCVIWKHLYRFFGLKIEVGMELIASGQANIYPPSGKLSFVANSIELVGEGALKKAYDQLKRKLTVEGIFADERKRAIPHFPQKVGVITSKQGAVIHDFMNNLGKHGYQITLIDARVEGLEALPSLYNAIRTMKNLDLDVIVIMRGGGSLQSLAAFDSERFIREVVSSPIPVIAAIGHHQDVPLCALAADSMVSTPTAAANLLNKSWEQALYTVLTISQSILFAYKELLNNVEMTIQDRQASVIDKFNRVLHIFDHASSHLKEYVIKVSSALKSVSELLARNTQHIMSHMADALTMSDVQLNTIRNDKVNKSFAFMLTTTQEKIISEEKLINVHNPLRQLALGYSIIRGAEDRLVKSIKDVKIGDRLNLLTNDGTISSSVESLNDKVEYE